MASMLYIHTKADFQSPVGDDEKNVKG